MTEVYRHVAVDVRELPPDTPLQINWYIGVCFVAVALFSLVRACITVRTRYQRDSIPSPQPVRRKKL